MKNRNVGPGRDEKSTESKGPYKGRVGDTDYTEGFVIINDTKDPVVHIGHKKDRNTGTGTTPRTDILEEQVGTGSFIIRRESSLW